MESIFISIFFDEEEFILLILEHTPSGRELEEDRIEGKLESIFPLLDLGVVRSPSIERIESTSCLIVRDDK